MKKLIFAMLLCALSGCSKALPSSDFESLKSIDYFLRWEHGEFAPQQSWLPAARAELPPQYQEAFSLYIKPNHSTQTLQAEFYERMVTDDKSQKFYKKSLQSSEYNALKTLLGQKFQCQTQVQHGWVGPAPRMMRLSFATKDHLFYVGGARGPAGPQKDLYESKTRSYLCSKELYQWMKNVIDTLKH